MLGLNNRLRFNNLVFFALEELLDDIKVLFDCEADSFINIVVTIVAISSSPGSGRSLSALGARVRGVLVVFFTIIGLLTIIILLVVSLSGDWRLWHRHLSHSECVHDEVSSSLVEVRSNHVDDDNNLLFFDFFLFLRGLGVI